jgi:hypothetical protein
MPRKIKAEAKIKTALDMALYCLIQKNSEIITTEDIRLTLRAIRAAKQLLAK